MNDERLGIVRLPFAGRSIPLRFTWRAIDAVGRAGVGELLDKAGQGEAGDMAALARLLEVASDGELNAEEMMNGDAPAFATAYLAVLQAWTAAVRQPEGEAGTSSENPLLRLWTSSKRLWGRLWAA